MRRLRTMLLAAGVGMAVVALGAGPQAVASTSPTFEAISAGPNDTCAITSVGDVQCWGVNTWGQLGDGTTTDSSSPVDVEAFPTLVTRIDAGYEESCAVMSNGGARCWGLNDSGQLGDGTIGGFSSTPVDVIGLSGGGVSQIAAGDHFACALMSGGGVECWGLDEFGELGDGGSEFQSANPVAVSGLSGIVAISAGRNYACALTSGGSLDCWGEVPSCICPGGVEAVPAQVVFSSPVKGLSAGEFHGCARMDTWASCWGPYGPPGADPTNGIGIFITASFTAISSGGEHDCGLTDGGVVCWGLNVDGQLGDGEAESFAHQPVDVTGLSSGVSAISAGEWHTCALLSDGTAECWGDNTYGELGNGTTKQSATPTPVGTDNDLSIADAPDVTAAATGADGASVTFTAPAASDEDGETPTVTCDPSSGSTFPVGQTSVTCTATDPDDANGPVSTSFTVTVTDTDLALTNVPTGITLDAAGPGGATVTYTPPTAVDEEGSPTVDCSPASGSMFAIGPTTVTCSASDTDDTNSPATASFQVTVKGAADQLHDLLVYVVGLPPGTSLVSKLQLAISYFQAGNKAAACSELTQVINQAKAQSNKHLTVAQATEVIGEATRIRGVIGC